MMINKFKKLSILFFIFSTTTLLIGCTKEEFEDKPKDNNTLNENIHITETSYTSDLLENLTIDATIQSSDISEAPILIGKTQTLNIEDLSNTLLGTSQIDYQVQNEYIDLGLCENKLISTSFYGYFYVTSTLYDTITSTAINSYGHNYILKPDLNVFSDDDLTFMTKSDAVTICTDILDKLSINYLDNPEIYSLDYEGLKLKYDEALNDEYLSNLINIGKIPSKDNWSKDDEGYFIIFTTKIGDLPLSSIGYDDKNTTYSVEGSQIICFVNKDGLDSIKSQGNIYTKTSTMDSPSNLISLEESVEILKSKYENIILTNENVIEEISLQYIPCIKDIQSIDDSLLATEYYFKPAWVFKIKSNLPDDDRSTHRSSTSESLPSYTYIFENINAITGEFIE